jgi:hypothetical protein
MSAASDPKTMGLPGDAPASHAARRAAALEREIPLPEVGAELARLTAENAALRAERDAAQNGERKALERSRSAFRQLSEAEVWLKAVADQHDILCGKCMGTGKDTSPFDRDERIHFDPRDVSDYDLGWCEDCPEPDCLDGHEMPVPRPEAKL